MKSQPHLYIDGDWIEPHAAALHEVNNPMTERPIASVNLGGAAEVDMAVRVACTAFQSFAATSKVERLALLDRIRHVYAARPPEVGTPLTLEMGSPVNAPVQGAGPLERFRQAREGGRLMAEIALCGVAAKISFIRGGFDLS